MAQQLVDAVLMDFRPVRHQRAQGANPIRGMDLARACVENLNLKNSDN